MPSFCNFRQVSVTFLSWVKIFSLNTQFLSFLNLRSSVRMTDQISHPYKIGGKFYNLFPVDFLEKWRKDKRFWTKR